MMERRTLASLSALYYYAAVGPAQAIEPKARPLTIDEVLRVVSTETGTEFEWAEDSASKAIASRIWLDSNKFEWEKASKAELLNDQKYPYMLCHTGSNPDGSPISGYKRALALADAIDYSEGDELYLRPLYNKEDQLCVYGQLYASVAANVSGSEFLVQPVVPSLKMIGGSFDSIKDEVESHNTDNVALNPSLDMVLCPGVAVADANATDAEITTVSEWEEIPSDMAQEIVDMLVPKTIASQLAVAITDTYYLTSDAYVATMEDSGEKPTERSKEWKQLIKDYQESGKCDDAYSNLLKWTIQRARNPDTDVSLMSVEFDTTGNTEHDVGCMLTLAFAIAAHPSVCSLESRERVRTHNTVSQWLTQSEVRDKRPFFDVGLDGTGQVVAVSDTGIDRDNCYFGDSSDAPSVFVDTSADKIAQYIPFVDSRDAQYGHGTHVAGTIAGARRDGAGMADGVAPGAKLAFMDIGDANQALRLPLDSQLLATGSPVAKIHSMSWGSEINFYTTQSRNFDQHMYDDDEFLIVVAAGNSGAGDARNTVGSPATGKNVVAVGAHHNTEKSRPKNGLGPSYVADFSSRGPTADGRMKPDLLAPGKAVLSAGALPNEFGECDPSKIPAANSKSAGLLSLQGTSMATPVVSGIAAIIRQYFVEGYYPTGMKNETDVMPSPSGALIKAVLMNGAQFLRGVDNGINGVTTVAPYDNNQGFGRLSLQDSLYIPGRTEANIEVFDRQRVEDGERMVYAVNIDKSNGCTYDRLSVTLVWFEQGSTPGCTFCVLNDLDLTVELGGRTYHPNGLSGPDRTNNAERVVIEGVKDGDEATITVRGFNLMQRSQQFALVATGCFGGVANRNFANECSVFDCDDSEDTRFAKIMMAIFIPLGVILLCCCGMFVLRKMRSRQSSGGGARYDDGGAMYDD